MLTDIHWNPGFRHCSLTFQWAFSPTERFWMADTLQWPFGVLLIFRKKESFFFIRYSLNLEGFFFGGGGVNVCVFFYWITKFLDNQRNIIWRWLFIFSSSQNAKNLMWKCVFSKTTCTAMICTLVRKFLAFFKNSFEGGSNTKTIKTKDTFGRNPRMSIFFNS